jgi:uncharacterized protein with GYD domain
MMQTYLCLLSWTKEGVEKVKDSPSRLDEGKKAFAAAGCKINTVLLLMGQYDMAIVAEAPDDATIARLALSLASKGSVRTETVRAFTEDEYRKIIAGIS